MIRNLKKNGFCNEELVTVYKTMIRPVFDYGCVVYHSSLTDAQDELLERLQSHTLKAIFGVGPSAREVRQLANIETLRSRREDLCDKFVQKCLHDPRFQHWFPLRKGRRSSRRGAEMYREETARCKRLFDSPLLYFRRRLNGKVGKTYGSRNTEYRTDPS